MFDIGFWELAILFGLGLIVLGPEKLPRVANQLGNWAGQARRMARNLSAQMRSEIDLNDPLNINKPASSNTTKQTKADENKVDTPAWQTSAGLRPGYSSEEEESNGSPDDESYEHEKVAHGEFEPLADNQPESTDSTLDSALDSALDSKSDKGPSAS